MQLFDRAVADSDETIQLAARENDVLIRTSRTVMYSRLVEGRFRSGETSSRGVTTR